MKRLAKSIKWYIAMEYLPGRFGIVRGPFRSKKRAMSIDVNHHHCLIANKKHIWKLLYRKNTGRWKKVEPQRIQLNPQKSIRRQKPSSQA